ncbi:unnamed protein product, partial [Chrysoparadoxa australica]
MECTPAEQDTPTGPAARPTSAAWEDNTNSDADTLAPEDGCHSCSSSVSRECKHHLCCASATKPAVTTDKAVPCGLKPQGDDCTNIGPLKVPVPACPSVQFNQQQQQQQSVVVQRAEVVGLSHTQALGLDMDDTLEKQVRESTSEEQRPPLLLQYRFNAISPSPPTSPMRSSAAQGRKSYSPMR